LYLKQQTLASRLPALVQQMISALILAIGREYFFKLHQDSKLAVIFLVAICKIIRRHQGHTENWLHENHLHQFWGDLENYAGSAGNFSWSNVPD
jgi:hypothetical protein